MQSPFGAKAEQTVRQTGKTGDASGAALIYLVKTIPLCRGMAWLPFQKCQQAKGAFLEKGQYVHGSILSSILNKKFLFSNYTNFASGVDFIKVGRMAQIIEIVVF